MTSEALALQAQAALARGDLLDELRLRLRLIRSLVAEAARADAQALLPRAEREAREHPALALELALARASLDASGSLGELRSLLAQARPGSIEDRLEAWSILAEAYTRQGDWQAADLAWASASQLSDTAELALSRASALIRAGRAQDALPLLERATLGPELVELAARVLRSGLLLELGLAERVEADTERVATLARARHNHHLLSCAVLDQAEAWSRQGEPGRGEALIRSTLAELRAQGEPGLLLIARLIELQPS